MTEFEIKHGLSQDEPGPLEPVELAQQHGAAPATGNTARDQEMYTAGIRTGEENTKHNAAIRASVAAPAAGDALDALRELVECDNIKKRIASMQVCILETDDDVQELDAMMSDLARRQPAAWDAARAALAAQRKGGA